MTGDLEVKLGTWMQSLPVSSTSIADLQAIELPARRTTRGWMPRLRLIATATSAVVVIAVIALLSGSLIGGGFRSSPAPSNAGQSASPAIAEPLPTGGLTEAQAVARADFYGPSHVVLGARAGRLWQVMGMSPRADGQGWDQWVWAVAFAGNVHVGDPTHGVIDSPVPGTVTIYLDYFSGAVIESSSEAATPSPGN